MELVIISTGILNIVCFFIGAKIGQTVSKGEKIETPNPIKKIEEYKDRIEEKKEQQELNDILENINNYDGTGFGQKDIEER